MVKGRQRWRKASYARLHGTTILCSCLVSAALILNEAHIARAEPPALEFSTTALPSYAEKSESQTLLRFLPESSTSATISSRDAAGLSLWQPHAEGAISTLGDDDDLVGSIGLFLPAYQTGDGMVFVDMRGNFGDNSSRQGSVGVGYRQIAPGLFFGEDAIFGVNAYLDALHSEDSNNFVQGSVGLELITRHLEFHANAYIAKDDPQLLSSVPFSMPTLNGTAVVQQSGTRLVHENAFSGFDLSSAFKVELSEDSLLRAHAGYSEFEQGGNSFKGPRAGLELEIDNAFGLDGSRFSVGGEVYDDSRQGTDFSGFIRLRVPLGTKAQRTERKSGSILDLNRQITNRVRRQERIFTEGITTTRNVTETPLVDAATGDALHAFFISQVPLGLGDCSSVFNACTFATASANPNLGAGDAFIAVDGGGANSSILTFSANNQMVVGGGDTGMAVLSFSDAANSSVVLTGLGGRPLVAGVDVGAHNDATISGITTTGPGGITGDGFGGTLNIFDVHTNNGGINLINPNMAVVHVTNSMLNGMDGAGITATSGTPGGLRFNLSNSTIMTSGAGPAVDVSGTNVNDVTVFGFANNTVTGTGGVSFDNVTFDADGHPVNGIAQVEGGTLSIGEAGGPVSGNGLHLNEVLGDLAFTTLDVTNNAGTGVFIRDDAGKAGSFAFSTTGGTITTTNGAGVDIDPVTLNVTLNSLTASGGVNGVLLDTVSGSFTVLGGAISNTSGAAFSLNNSDIDVSFGASIDNAAGNAVRITNQSGGMVEFTGAITETGAGIDLQDNTGATIGFSGGLDIDTTGVTGFSATGGGTIWATGSANSIDAMNATALHLDGVSIGGAGLTFDAISSTNAAGDGISLTDVAGGMLSVTGMTTITDPGDAGIDIKGINTASFNFGDLDIALGGANQTGIDLQTATLNGDVSASDFDLTSTSAVGTTAVNLSSTVGSGTIQLGDTNAAGESATIAGVDVGIQFSAGTDTTFIFGDGEQTTDELSTISANVAISANPAPVNGSYNFLDVDLTSATLDFAATSMSDFIFVAANATGDGSGTSTDNLANVVTADAITSSNTIFVLVNDGNDIVDADGFTLSQGQNIEGFGNGNSLTVGTIVPASFMGVPSNTTSIADPTGNGVATLSATGFAVVDAAGDNMIENVIIGDGLIGVDVNGDNVILGGGDGSLIIDGSTVGVDLGEATGICCFRPEYSEHRFVGLECYRYRAWHVEHR